MNKKIDHLFKNKLREQQMAPPPAAWNKIQHQLYSKKNQKSLVYYKIASVCLLLLISALAYRMLYNDSTEFINSNEEVANNSFKHPEREGNGVEKNSSSNEISQVPETTTEKEEQTRPKQQLAKSESKSTDKIILPKRENVKHHTPEVETERKEFEPEIETLIVENNHEQKVLTADNEGFSEITITYKRGNSVRTSTIQRTTADATVLEKEKTTVKKLIQIAKELKVSEINLADIRDSKEDLLSMEVMKLKN